MTQTPPATPGQPPTHPVDVFLLLIDGDQVLLALREGTGYADGMWNAPSGKMEYGEDALAAVRREAGEEIGVAFGAEEPRFVAVVHHLNQWHGRIGLVFVADYDVSRHGVPVNREPHKCAGLRWFPGDGIPAETYPYTAAAITAWRTGTGLQFSGWLQQQPSGPSMATPRSHP